MATLARGGRITTEIIDEEIARLRTEWQPHATSAASALLLDLLAEETLAAIDPFKRVQLQHVIDVARRSLSLSDAGRLLFTASRPSRRQKTSTNDADRLRKHLARFGLVGGRTAPATPPLR